MGIICITLSILFFDRFKRHGKKAHIKTKAFLPKHEDTGNEAAVHFNMAFSPAKMSKHNNIALVINEMRVMMLRLPLWQFILIIGGAAALPFLGGNITPLIMLIPIPILSKIGCQNKIQRTIEIVHASCSPTKYLLITYIAGIVISLIISSIQLIYLGISGGFNAILSWLIGIVLACALALFCGEFTGNKKLFEAVYILIYYLWLNKVTLFDFLGTTGNEYNLLYILTTLLLVLACFVKHSGFNKG